MVSGGVDFMLLSSFRQRCSLNQLDPMKGRRRRAKCAHISGMTSVLCLCVVIWMCSCNLWCGGISVVCKDE